MTATLTPAEAPSPAAPEPAAAAPKKKRRRPTFGLIFAVTFLAALTFMAFFADYLSFIRYPDSKFAEGARYKIGPGADFWFGTEKLGRDVFARCIYGAKYSLQIGVYATIIGLITGGFLGVIAGYYRGWVDRVVSIIIDCLLAIPALLFAILLVNRLDDVKETAEWLNWLTRQWQIVLALSILATAPLARIVRAQTMSLREREFVLAARSLGAKPARVMFREILPSLVPAMLTVAFTALSILIASEGALAFLGLGLEIGTPTWGTLIEENRTRIDDAWWATIFPCLMLFLTVLSFNIIGDRLSRRFDIRQAGV